MNFHNSPRNGTRLSPSDIFAISKKFVYSPCKKLTGFIELADRLGSDLGFAGDSRNLLAFKTNQVFQMEAPDNFTSLEVAMLDTVQDHVCAVCTKLARSGRLVGGEPCPHGERNKRVVFGNSRQASREG